MTRYRELARELEQVSNELEGDRGATKLRDAADELRDQCAAIVRRLNGSHTR